MGVGWCKGNWDSHTVYMSASRQHTGLPIIKVKYLFPAYETLFPDDDQILRNVHEWVKERIC